MVGHRDRQIVSKHRKKTPPTSKKMYNCSHYISQESHSNNLFQLYQTHTETTRVSQSLLLVTKEKKVLFLGERESEKCFLKSTMEMR